MSTTPNTATQGQLAQCEKTHACEPGRINFWGIQCRTCNKPIALGSRLDPRTADYFKFLKPGSFRLCPRPRALLRFRQCVFLPVDG